ncbi:Small multidrug resistance protein [Agrobacterium tumefaciens]|nr:Small multidrug resistance protein [Agrobacterium tumefaciens]
MNPILISYGALAVAIICEVTGSTFLQKSEQFTRLVPTVDNLSRNQDIAVGLQVILKPRARPTPTWTSMPERTLDFEF